MGLGHRRGMSYQYTPWEEVDSSVSIEITSSMTQIYPALALNLLMTAQC